MEDRPRASPGDGPQMWGNDRAGLQWEGRVGLPGGPDVLRMVDVEILPTAGVSHGRTLLWADQQG